MKKLEQWEKTQFILAGYKTLCGLCHKAPVEKELSRDGVGLLNHCVNCWVTVCYKGMDETLKCAHGNSINLHA